MRVTVNCASCGELVFKGETREEIRDQIAEHLMLTHGATEWEEEGPSEDPSGGPERPAV